MTDRARRAISGAYANAEAFRRHWASELSEAGAGLVEGLSLDGARRVLDLGAGIGVNLPALGRAAPSAVVVGVDLVESMIAAAPREFPRAVMDASRVGFADASFDAVLMAFMLFHVPVPAAALAEVFRVLRRGGQVAIGTWAAEAGDFPANDVWISLLDELGAAPPEATVMNHEQMDTPSKTSALLESAGFTEISTATRVFEDPTDLEGFLERRTVLGFSRVRFESLPPSARPGCLSLARARLSALSPEDFVAHERAIFTWARRP